MTTYAHTTAPAIDSADPIIEGRVYDAREAFLLDIPAAGGPFVDAKGATATNGARVFAVYPTGGTAPDPAALTPAQFLAMEMVEGPGASGTETINADGTIKVGQANQLADGTTTSPPTGIGAPPAGELHFAVVKRAPGATGAAPILSGVVDGDFSILDENGVLIQSADGDTWAKAAASEAGKGLEYHDPGKDYTAAEDVFLLEVPATGGPYVTASPQSMALLSGDVVPLRYLADRAAADAADVLDTAELALMQYVGESRAKVNQAAPSLMVGNRWIWNRTDAIPDHLLPLDGQVVADADTLYPELWAVRSLSALVASFNDTAKTITLEDHNTRGRFPRAGTTPGVKQDHQFEDHEHPIRTNTSTSGQSAGGHNAFWGWNGSISQTPAGMGSLGANTGNPGAETRPINVSEVWCIIAKPWLAAGDVTINQVADLPTSFIRGSSWNGLNVNNAVSTACYRGGGTGTAGTGRPSNAWEGLLKVTRINDWVEQMWWDMTAGATAVGSVYVRHSFDGGTTWEPWWGH